MRVILVTGGARSGKSSYALREAERAAGRRAYVATAEALDEEMAERIAAHQGERGRGWDTFEEPTELSDLIGRIKDDYGVIIVDCLTMWLANLLARGPGREEETAARETARLIQALGDPPERAGGSSHLYLVSNEVGMGIVPANRTARLFRDAAGRLNQIVAAAADEVVLVVSGLPLHVKGEVQR